MGLIPEFLTNNAGALAGGLLGFLGNSGSGKANETTVSKDPWAAAQPYMLKNLQNEADLQQHYQKTPFNAQQQQGYSNLFGDIGNFRDNVAPGLLGFANNGMTSSYQRQRGGAPGSGGGYGGAVRPGGMSQSGQGPFSVARGAQAQNPMLDLNGAQNPHVNGGIKQPEPKAFPAMAGGGLLGGGYGGAQPGGNGGNGGQSTDGSNYGGIGIGAWSDKLSQQAQDTFSTIAPASVVAAAVAALVQKGMSEQAALAAVNETGDPIGALAALQQMTDMDPNYNYYDAPSYSGGVPKAGGYNTGVGSYGGSLWGGGNGGNGNHSIGG